MGELQLDSSEKSCLLKFQTENQDSKVLVVSILIKKTQETTKRSWDGKDIQNTIYYKNMKYGITSVTIQQGNIVPKLMRGCKSVLRIKLILLPS